MAILLQHPEHGYHHVYSNIDLENHKEMGWSEVVEEIPKPIEPAKQVETGFKCNECGKPFAMKMHLNNHLRSHKR